MRTDAHLILYPPSLKALVDDRLITWPKIFLRPRSGTKPVPGKFVSNYDSILDRVDFKLTESNVPMGLPLAWEKKYFLDDGIVVVYFDSHVEFMLGEDAFERLLKQVDDWIAEQKGKLEEDKGPEERQHVRAGRGGQPVPQDERSPAAATPRFCQRSEASRNTAAAARRRTHARFCRAPEPDPDGSSGGRSRKAPSTLPDVTSETRRATDGSPPGRHSAL